MQHNFLAGFLPDFFDMALANDFLPAFPAVKARRKATNDDHMVYHVLDRTF